MCGSSDRSKPLLELIQWSTMTTSQVQLTIYCGIVKSRCTSLERISQRKDITSRAVQGIAQ